MHSMQLNDKLHPMIKKKKHLQAFFSAQRWRVPYEMLYMLASRLN